jgi:hypothetical protein
VIFRVVPFSQVAVSLSLPLVPKGGLIIVVFGGDVPCNDASLYLSVEGRALPDPDLKCFKIMSFKKSFSLVTLILKSNIIFVCVLPAPHFVCSLLNYQIFTSKKAFSLQLTTQLELVLARVSKFVVRTTPIILL